MRAVVVVALVALFATTAYAVTCAEYCALLNTACTGASGTANAFPYLSTAGCEKVCASFPTTGTDGDASGNTIQCRYYHASVANGSTNAALTHCKHAASGGSATCGSTCDSYCNIMTYATAPNAASLLTRAPYEDVVACNAYCTKFFQTTGGQPNPALAVGNTAECREYHARVAMELDSATHYLHALPESTIGQCTRVDATGDVYSSAVENYCDYALAYCGNTMDNATYAGAYYSSRANCLAQASYLPRGWVSDGYNSNTSNSLDCRIYHMGVASAYPSHCYHSGINGLNQCGTDSCSSYCQQIDRVCTGTYKQFNSYEACYTQCLAYSDATTITSGPYATSGNTLSCRFYHLGVAAGGAQATHCIHAGPSGEGYCGDRVAGYCNLVQEACSLHSTTDDCLKYAAIYPTTGALNDVSGNTQFCRMYHAGVATMSSALATVHCPHAGYSGGVNVSIGEEVGCGTACQNYCNLVLNACNSTTLTGVKQYASRTECETTCAAFPKGAAADTGVDTLGCRMYHAKVAFDGDATTRTTHCPHAGPSGGATCGSVVESVCDVEYAACTGTNAQWATRAACIADLTGISEGTFGATSGNSLQCRLYHGMVALNGDAAAKLAHCPHTSKSNSVCGDAASAASPMSSASIAFAAVIVGAVAVL